MTWLAGHTWDPEAFWRSAQWGDGTVTTAGVLMAAEGKSTFSSTFDIKQGMKDAVMRGG